MKFRNLLALAKKESAQNRGVTLTIMINKLQCLGQLHLHTNQEHLPLKSITR